MNAFTIISSLILYGLTALSFLVPFKNGKKVTAYTVGATLFILITWTFISDLEFLVIFIWPLIVIFQTIFLSYWGLKVSNRPKTALIVAAVLAICFIVLIMQPWISDWTFNKGDVDKVLTFHNLQFKDDFEIIKNEAGGFRDYYETFTLKLSEGDLNRMAQTIKTSKDYKGYYSDYVNLPGASHQSLDTVDFETMNYLEREFWTDRKTENGTFHFRFQLDKQNKEFRYTGSDE